MPGACDQRLFDGQTRPDFVNSQMSDCVITVDPAQRLADALGIDLLQGIHMLENARQIASQLRHLSVGKC